MASVTLSRVSKTFNQETYVVKDVSLEIQDKEFVVLVGPSGCGKTTLLRMIAGLEDVSSGDIYIDQKRINDVSPKDRDISMVFQSYALYPHMNVFDNIAFSLKLRKTPREEIKQRVEEVSGFLGVASLLKRKPKELSGGQRQRVAMGRAIVRRPKVFLMDEPLSNLDAQLRTKMRAELQKLHQQLQATIIYVTHDQTEAMTLGTRIVVLNDGAIQQVASPIQVYQHPLNRFVAEFVGNPPMNLLAMTLTEKTGKLFAVNDSLSIQIPADKIAILTPYIGKAIVIGIRPEDVHDKQFFQSLQENVFTAMVEVYEPIGSEVYLHLKLASTVLVARVNADTKAVLGKPLEIILDSSKLHFFDPENGKNLESLHSQILT